MNKPTSLSDRKLTHLLKKDIKVRRTVARRSHQAFADLYLSNHLDEPPAPFHSTLFQITENLEERFSVIVAFRGSAKTTIMGLSFPLWSIVGVQQRKFVLIVSETQQQSAQILENIKSEFEQNKLLRHDLGPFQTPTDSWSAESIEIPKYEARITAVSVETAIRGLKHNQYRPDLIIFDDVQSMASVKTRELRDKRYQWIVADALAAGDPKRLKVVVVGNLLHDDSVTSRFREEIKEGKRSGRYYEFPLIDKASNIAWPGRFPTLESIEKLKLAIGNKKIFQREYMLQILPEFDQVVFPEWISYYADLPTIDPTRKVVGIDLAISKRDSADYTAMVSGYLYWVENEPKLFLLPHPVNSRIDFPEAIEQAIRLVDPVVSRTTFYVEEVQYQASFTQALEKLGQEAIGMPIHGMEKRERLALVSHLIQNGTILFPEHGAERLIEQLIGFGSESHDDLADAFSTVAHGLMKLMRDDRPMVTIVASGSMFSDYLRDFTRFDPNMKF